MITNTTCPSSGIQSHKYITIPCETHVQQTLREPSTLREQSKCTIWNAIIFYYNVICTNITWATLGTYCEDGDGPSRPLTQQLVQLLFRQGVHNETEDEEDRKDNAQSPAQERVKADAFVVGRISPVCTQRKSGFNITLCAAGNIW